MPCADKVKDEVLPEINQSNSATTARRKTRLVVKRGSIRIGGSPGLVEVIEREKRRGCGAKIEYVPVPVLQVQELRTLNSYCGSKRLLSDNYLSGRCSPSAIIRLIRFKYWYSSWSGERTTEAIVL
jgi:hypothetical protein